MRFLFSLFVIGMLFLPRLQGAEFPVFTATDRVLILAPHPDDEILGTGGIIQKALAAKANVRIVFLTMGDNYEWAFMAYRKRPVLKASDMRQMGEVRRKEAIAADNSLRVPTSDIVFLGYPDWGTLAIWTRYWGEVPPYRSLLTRASAVPYADAYRPGALYRGQDIVHDLEAQVRDFHPTQIFVSHPADAHRDHRSLYLYLRVALWNLDVAPPVHTYLVHFKNWPRPWGRQDGVPLAPPGAISDEGQWVNSPLSPQEQEAKAAALAQHATQFNFDRKFLSSFLRPNEIFDHVSDIALSGSSVEKDLSTGAHGADRLAAPEELGPDEQKDFIGIDWHTLARNNDQLVVTLRLSRALAGRAGAALYVFGWRPDKAFSAMPKLHVHFGLFGVAVDDGGKPLAKSGVTVFQKGQTWQVSVPLAVLDHPTRLLTGAKTFIGAEPAASNRKPNAAAQTLSNREPPLDWTSWRAVVL